MLEFLGIGAQKAGTTWLFEQLRRSPEIRFSEHKEVHFWDQHRARGLEWYRGLFPNEKGIRWGDITPAYGILPPDVIAEVRREFPQAKLLFLMRNPIDRAWSSALMALRRAELKLEEASDQWFLDHFHSEGSRLRGDYRRTIANWTAQFPKEQLWVGRYDEIIAKPRELLRSCAAHLGVSTDFIEGIPESALTEKVYAGPGYELRASLRPALEKLYADSVWFERG